MNLEKEWHEPIIPKITTAISKLADRKKIENPEGALDFDIKCLDILLEIQNFPLSIIFNEEITEAYAEIIDDKQEAAHDRLVRLLKNAQEGEN